jgi:DNA-binding transcriptional MerR regulator
MYKISEFSKITKLTVKALRYYDEQDILKPSYRAENLYRYYDDNDFKKAQLIVLLRGLDFNISEIKDIVSQYAGDDDLSYYLVEKQQMIRQQIKKQRALIEKIDTYLQPNKGEENSMNYKIEDKIFDAVTVVSVRYKGRYNEVGKYIGDLYKLAKGKASGPAFNCYYDEEYKEQADIELCLPVDTFGNASTKQLPKIKAISTIHTGSYQTLNMAYKALMDYAKSHNIECKTPSREIYHKGPGMIFKGNPNKYITEIILPYEII